MQKICASCTETFSILEEDSKIYEKIGVPEPEQCFNCRQQHLMAFINHLNLYQRKCDATGEPIISNYSPESPYKIYKMEYYWSDQWDAAEYGMDFDFNKPFFEQYQELSLKVPRPALFTAFQYDENSQYTNHAGKNKNCYMIFDSDENRDCFYSYSLYKCNDCSDSYRTRQSELCYESIDSTLCYNSAFIKDSSECRDSAFLENCRACKNCFMCVNLQHKEYCYKNEFVGKEKFEELIKQLASRERAEELKKEFNAFRKKFPKRFLQIYKSENAVGNYLVNCKNAHMCFDGNNLWDCRYVTQSFMDNIRDCVDCVEVGGGAELIYMSATAGYNASRLKFCQQVLDQIHEAQYACFCHFSSNLFGCIGLRRKKFHILNKKYEPDEYKLMVEKITEHMKKTGEYGKFFPYSLSPFSYNETTAQQWYPLTKEQALAKGFNWRDQKDEFAKMQAIQTPDNITETSEETCSQILECANCRKKYRITTQELALHKRLGVAIASLCFKCRHFARANVRTQRKIFTRHCDSCYAEIQSGIPETSDEIVYCEKCYLEKVY